MRRLAAISLAGVFLLAACGGDGSGTASSCEPEADTAFCGRLAAVGKICGQITAPDNCEVSRTVDCGTTACVGGSICTSENKCECASESDETFCARQADLGRTCGSITATDACGVSKTVDCGTAACVGGTFCNGSNACECAPENEDAFCARQAGQGKVCGSITGADNCGTSRTVDCGTLACVDGTVCGTSNACECAPEDAAAFCMRQAGQGKVCGSITAADNCGMSRTVDCGSTACATGTICNSSNACECAPEDAAAFCANQANQGRVCGSITSVDNCGESRTVDCGTAACTAGTVCNSSNSCECAPEDAAAFCARQALEGRVCGSITANDLCGRPRTVNCGMAACTGVTTVCDGSNACVCPAETEAQFCSRQAGLGLVCGSITAADNCGITRTVDCGSAACVGSTVCNESNVCVCVPESDTTFCSRQAGQGKVCGSITANDNCSSSRTVDCGSTACTGGSVCNPSNACVCTSDSEAEFCVRQAGMGRECGAITGDDLCGRPWTVDCGTDACVDGTVCSANNICLCVLEANVDFCARQAGLGKACGLITGLDNNCGTITTVNCGTSACTGLTSVCDGATNQCIEAGGNDTCAGAIALTPTVPVRGDTTNATADYGTDLSSACDNYINHDAPGSELVYSYTPASNGVFNVVLTPSVDLLLWATTGTCGGDGGDCMAASDFRGGRSEYIQIQGVAGTTYYLYVDSYDTSVRGSFTIEIACNPLDFTSCGAGMGCYYSHASVYKCQPAGTAAANSPCESSSSVTCVPGTDCVEDSVGTYCRPFCDPSGDTPPAACVSPLTCNDWHDGGGNCMQ